MFDERFTASTMGSLPSRGTPLPNPSIKRSKLHSKMRPPRSLSILLLLADTSLCAQTPLSFDVASVRPTTSTTPPKTDLLLPSL